MVDWHWRPWFAWHPIRLGDGRWCWMRSVERGCRLIAAPYCTPWFEWRYRARAALGRSKPDA